MEKFFLVNIGVLLLILGYEGVSGACPTDWIHHSNSCYLFVVRYPVEWIDAVNYCKMFGGKLAEVESSTEDFFLKQRIGQLHVSANFWLGGDDILAEGKWTWESTGQAFVYTGWHSSEPNNYRGSENCVIMTHNYNGDWSDTGCSERHAFVCEMSV